MADDHDGPAPSTTKDPYKELCDASEQLTQDISLFRTICTDEIKKDPRHEEVVDLSDEMLRHIRTLLALDKAFLLSQVQPDFYFKMWDAITELTNLMLPPKVMGGYCPCFKPSRSGLAYDTRFYTVHSKILLATFLAQSVSLDHSAEHLISESLRFALLTKKMNVVFNTLSEIKTQGNDKIRDKAKNELAAACNTVNKFVQQHFGEEEGYGTVDPVHAEFSADATQRIIQTTELLTSRTHAAGAPGMAGGGGGSDSHKSAGGGGGAGRGGAEGVASPRSQLALDAALSRRVLVKAQSSLQEIMNSAAAITDKRARVSCRELDDLSDSLHASFDRAAKGLAMLRKRMKESDLTPMLQRQKQDCEDTFQDVTRKIEDADKRWKVVQQQSKTRPVAEYDDGDMPPTGKESKITSADLKDPSKLIAKTGKSMQKGATQGKALAKDVLKTALGIGQLIGEDLRSLTGSGEERKPSPVRKKKAAH